MIKYQIQFQNDCFPWIDYAETSLGVYAQEIADSLLKNGKHRVRINQIEEKVVLGDVLGKKN